MTNPLFLQDPYRAQAPGRVAQITPEGAVVLEDSLFYPTGGGQPGDSGQLVWDGGTARVTEARKGEGGTVLLLLEEGAPVPPVGAVLDQQIDMDRRMGHMRVHTCLHLLSVVIPLPVSGGSISADKGRLDFAMPEPPEDKPALQEALQALIDRDLAVTEDWITDADLDANPGLVKTMSVAPPRGAGRVRLVRIGTADEQVDLQPCGGTHVARTGEIGCIRIGKIEKKGRQNRRVYVHLDG